MTISLEEFSRRMDALDAADPAPLAKLRAALSRAAPAPYGATPNDGRADEPPCGDCAKCGVCAALECPADEVPL